MASKYAEVMKGLVPVPVEDEKYQAKVQKVKEELLAEGPLSPQTLASTFINLRKGHLTDEQLDGFIDALADTINLLGKDGIEEILSRINLRLTALEQLMTESLEREDEGWGLYGATPTMVRLPDGSSVNVQHEPTGKVKDREAFRLWCIANGLENSLQLWPSTMNAIVKERLLAGESTPDGVEAYIRPKIVVRKG